MNFAKRGSRRAAPAQNDRGRLLNEEGFRDQENRYRQAWIEVREVAVEQPPRGDQPKRRLGCMRSGSHDKRSILMRNRWSWDGRRRTFAAAGRTIARKPGRISER